MEKLSDLRQESKRKAVDYASLKEDLWGMDAVREQETTRETGRLFVFFIKNWGEAIDMWNKQMFHMITVTNKVGHLAIILVRLATRNEETWPIYLFQKNSWW